MIPRLLKLPLQGSTSIFLFGPRGTGKTSFLKDHLPNALYFDLLQYSTYSTLLNNPDNIEELIPKGYGDWIIIDEIQQIPQLLNEVHRLIEHKKYKFILTGSSARSLRKQGANLLAGRALKYNIHPFVIQELGTKFNLEHALRYGLLPSAVLGENPKKYLETYVETYIRDEVQKEGLSRNLNSFSRFLEAASFSQGQVLNFSEIGRELLTSRVTVANYFDILEDMLLSTRITVFSQRAKRKVIAHQKFFFFDSGIFRILRPTSLLDVPEESEGATLETLFLQSLSAINDYYDLDYKIHFWRTLAGDEVDFVIFGPNGFHAFEIKRSSQVSSKSLKGLRAFGEEYPEAKLYFLFLGGMKEYHGNITAIPFEEALQELPQLISGATKQ